MDRPKVETRKIYWRGPAQREYLEKVLARIPFDEKNPVEIVIREELKKRKPTINEAMWAGTLRDIAEQAEYCGQKFSEDVWHEQLKELFLPDETREDFEPLHVLENYRKYRIQPITGNRILCGSTTQLTNAGMAHYLLQVESYMSQRFLVRFTTKEEKIGR